VQLIDLVALLDKKLTPWQFSDVAPNGLQIEGKSYINRILVGVTASQAVIDEAITAKADAILVHHGCFWKNESQIITGIKKHRIQTLLSHDINLIAYHLPLDAHLELGNNAMLAKIFNWQIIGQSGEQNLIWYGTTKITIAKDFVNQISQILNRPAQLLGDETKKIHRIAWCSGGAQNYFSDALALNVDAFITGEVSEYNYHIAQESGVIFIAAGHHATERYGIQALGSWLSNKAGIAVQNSTQHNPI
jgi:dinuclear metal center YbgI/SA1388 family protein